MASSISQTPRFEPFLCREPRDENPQRDFNPIAHDLIVLSANGSPRIAKNSSVEEMNTCLRNSNDSACSSNSGEDNTPLVLIRFEEDDSATTSFQPSTDWSQLWPFFDCCCNDPDTMEFVSRIRQTDPHYDSSVSKNTKSSSKCGSQCHKISYSFNCRGKHIMLAHHFHKVTGEYKEIIRMMTYGLPEEKIEVIFYKALQYIKSQDTRTGDESPDGLTCLSPASTPHPKAILCGMLESLEEQCRKHLAKDRKYIIERIEPDIKSQRDPRTRKPKGLEINYVKLSDARIRLGEVRQKLQYLESSIASLEETNGLPRPCLLWAPMCPKNADDGREATSEDHLAQKWWHQLHEVKTHLSGLKSKCQQHKINIENLAERVQGNHSFVSILLSERENEDSRQSELKRQRRAEFQMQMLKSQELIASRAKRDNSVMKVIAVLSAFFLPGTFVATFFSVPIFNWDQENVIGPHFMTYWYFTAPVTTVLVLGFTLWFAKMWYDDRRKERAEKVEGKDPEVRSSSETSSLGFVGEKVDDG